MKMRNRSKYIILVRFLPVSEEFVLREKDQAKIDVTYQFNFLSILANF